MKSKLEYKGFLGTVSFCSDDKIFYGKVVGLPNTLINYHGVDMESLYNDFIDAIEFHLECEAQAAVEHDSEPLKTVQVA